MDEEWKRSGHCRAIGVQEFFALGDAASKVCADCPVLAPCRRYADANRIEDGVWGGETERERLKRWRREARQRQKVNRAHQASLRNVQRAVAEHVSADPGPWHLADLAEQLRHPADDIATVLDGLVASGLIERAGPGRWCST